MDKVCKIIFVALLLSGTAYAFGSATKTSFVQVNENTTAEFSLLFWSEGNDEIFVDVIENSGIDVGLSTNRLQVSSIKGSEMIYISNKYISAESVKVYARIVPRGVYSILVSAKTFSSGGQILVSQERVFNLTVLSEESKKSWISEWFQGREEVINYVYIPLVIVIILIIAYAIYKYS